MGSEGVVLRQEPELIYVAGPITTNASYESVSVSEQERSVRRAIRVGIILLLLGHNPYVPHLNYFLQKEMSEEETDLIDYYRLLDWDFVILDRCDSLFYLAPCKGSDQELARAVHNGLKIYRSLEAIKAVGDIIGG